MCSKCHHSVSWRNGSDGLTSDLNVWRQTQFLATSKNQTSHTCQFTYRKVSAHVIFQCILIFHHIHSTWSDNKVRQLIAVKVLHSSSLNTTVVAFKVLPLGSYAPMPASSPPFKTILELVLWNGLQRCRCITPDVINVIKMPSFQYFL